MSGIMEWGVRTFTWAQKRWTWGTPHQQVDSPAGTFFAMVLSLEYASGRAPIRVWDGLGRMEFDGVVYGASSDYGLISVEGVESSNIIDNQKPARITMAFPQSDLESFEQRDPGVVSVNLKILAYTGTEWVHTGFEEEGFASEIAINFDNANGNTYTFRLETDYADVDRGDPAFYSDETWRARYDGDRFFSSFRQLVDGTRFERFPYRGGVVSVYDD